MEGHDDVTAESGYPAAVGQAADPFGMLKSAADLVNPVVAARELPWLAGEWLRVVSGQSNIWFDEKDSRFADVTWRDNLFYHRLGQGYRLYEEWMDRMASAVAGPWERQARTRYLANILTAAFSPTNFLPTNPLALKRAFETGGMSVFRGGQNMLRDLARGGMPRMVNRDPFPVGDKLACTPGAVVYRDEIFELLQYAPTTPAVRSIPLLMVPPELNRYYVLDLAPGRSMVQYAVEQGIQVYMIVWRNPRAELGHGRWGLEDYLAAQARAAEVVREISGSDVVNWLGLCAGGITASLTLGYLAAKGEASVGSATLIVTMLTSDHPNIVGWMGGGGSLAVLKQAAAAGQVFPGSALRTAFAWLRPNDLVFNYLVNGWLLGEDPPAFDVLAWNDDATAMTARLSAETSELLVEHKAARPGAITVSGTPIDLAKVDCDSFHVAGYTDHITPWRACYDSTQVLGGQKELVVVRSGHIQSFVNPAKTAKYGYWAAPPAESDPDRWIQKAAQHEGSWWPKWAEWLIPRSGAERQPPDAPGNPDFPSLGPAPGTYVHE
jgi:polyhydroxyalkanoate synthase subunit PhaC